MLTPQQQKPFVLTPGVVDTPRPPPLWYRSGVHIFLDDSELPWVDRTGIYVRFDLDATDEVTRVGPYIRLEELDI